MKDSELNELLKTARVPDRAPDYWERFPKRVMSQIHWRAQRSSELGSSRRQEVLTLSSDRANLLASLASTFIRGLQPRFLALGICLTIVCVAIGLFLGLWQRPHPAGGEQLTTVRKYFHEIEALFPNQVRAIVFDQQGPRLLLADSPDVPASPPLYLKICGPHGCQSFVTFSGQQIKVNGDPCDVLLNHAGDVLIVGHELVWSSSARPVKSGAYHIEARKLEATL